MRRRFEALGGSSFDLLVIGGGIYGAWVAYDATLRGLQVALVEKDDWASGTSSSSSKLVHGGLRYLEQGDIRLVKKALHERRLLTRLGPHRVRPLRFALPIYAGSRVGKWRLRAGLWLYDRMAGADQPVTPHRYLGAESMLRDYGFLRRDGLTGGFTYGDCQTDDARLVLEMVDGAVNEGAVAVNHAQVTELLHGKQGVCGARVLDIETGRTVELQAAVSVHCGGAWSPPVSGDVSSGNRRVTKGVHLVLPAMPTRDALLLMDNRLRRVIFLVPWYGRTLLGTTDTDYAGDPDRVTVEDADVSYLLETANRALQSPWEESDIVGSFAGLRVLQGGSGGAPSSTTRECRISESSPNLFTPVGGKLSSARLDAARLVTMVMQRLGRDGACSTGERPFPWCPGEMSEVGLDAAAVLSRERYGSRENRLHAILAESPDLTRRIVPGLPFCRGEIVHAARHEMARTLQDILRRRIPLTVLSPLPDEIVWDAALLAGDVLGWSEERRAQEAESLLTGGTARLLPA